MDDVDLYISCLAKVTHPVNGSLLDLTASVRHGPLHRRQKQLAETKSTDHFFYNVLNNKSIRLDFE